MWTLTFSENDHKYQVIYTEGNTGIFTDSSILDFLIETLTPQTEIVRSTPTGPTADLDISVGYLAYAFIGSILQEYFSIDPNWTIEGTGYEWPQETEEGTTSVFSGIDYLRKRAQEFYNHHHGEKGRFSESDGSNAGPAFEGPEVERPLNPKPPKEYFEASKTWEASLTDAERSAVIQYTGGYEYDPINKQAMTGESQINSMEGRKHNYADTIKALDSAIAKAPELETPMRVYRAIPAKVAGSALGPEGIKGIKSITFTPGQEISLAQPGAFQSTSATPRYPVARSFPGSSYIMEINTRHGAPIAGIAGGGTVKEVELLIPRSARFKVVAIHENVQFGKPITRSDLKRGVEGPNPVYTVVQVEEIEPKRGGTK
jgi:hypothetical protein